MTLEATLMTQGTTLMPLVPTSNLQDFLQQYNDITRYSKFLRNIVLIPYLYLHTWFFFGKNL